MRCLIICKVSIRSLYPVVSGEVMILKVVTAQTRRGVRGPVLSSHVDHPLVQPARIT